MAEAFIVDALRTPTGKRKGSLAHMHGADLGAHALNALVSRNAVPAEDYDDVIFGCLDAIGPLAGNIARTCWLAAGDAAQLAARKSLQAHGAMGYTWEADLQMFMKRAWALDATWGDRAFHKTRIAEAILADGAALGPGATFLPA